MIYTRVNGFCIYIKCYKLWWFIFIPISEPVQQSKRLPKLPISATQILASACERSLCWTGLGRYIYKHWCFVYRMLWLLMFCLSVERGVGTRTTVRTGPPQPWPGRSPFTPTQPRSCTSPDQGRSIQALCCSFLGGRILCIFMYSAEKKMCGSDRLC